MTLCWLNVNCCSCTVSGTSFLKQKGLGAGGHLGSCPTSSSHLCRYPCRKMTTLNCVLTLQRCIAISSADKNPVPNISPSDIVSRSTMKMAFLSVSYKIVRGSSAPPLHEVPFQVSTSASLVRSRVGHTLLKLERVVHFSVGCTAVFGEADIRILNQSGDKISWSFRVMYHFLAVSVESVWL